MKVRTISTIADMVIYMLQEQQFTDLAQFVGIRGTFQPSSTNYERRLSLMNHIKTKTLNRLEVIKMDQLIKIKYYFTQMEMSTLTELTIIG